ncbi:MAG: ATP-binding protein [Ktedonobacteraceae bacterium]|nr:ATP-binding protein [Chloroflexota bacterium]
MPTPLLIIISGPPGAGKTTLGRYLAQELHLPFLNKDDIKELLFDNLGWSDRPWSRKLGMTSYELLYHFIEVQLRAGGSLITESNFDPLYAGARFLSLKERYGFEPIQIQCFTEGTVLLERIKARSTSGERHPGHEEHIYYHEFVDVLLRGKLDSLDIGGQLLEVDTTDFTKVDYKKVLDWIIAKTEEE